MNAKDLKRHEDDVVQQLILQGDLSKLNASDRVTYYRGYCERIGLDPFTKPFDILRLNGREVLYLTRSGAQQLNKLHGVSHAITARDLVGGEIYQVTARATLPDGRHTESIGAVSVAGMKGENYCNAIMKAETKAKRRSTLDLLGLGILSEEEAVTINGGEIAKSPEIIEAEVVHDHYNQLGRQYDDPADVLRLIDKCENMAQLMRLYKANQPIAEDKAIRAQFARRKAEILTKQ